MGKIPMPETADFWHIFQPHRPRPTFRYENLAHLWEISHKMGRAAVGQSGWALVRAEIQSRTGVRVRAAAKAAALWHLGSVRQS
jgi:hypothetical protein